MTKEKLTDIQILGVDVSFEPVSFRAPLKFGGRVVDHTYLINAVVTVEGREAAVGARASAACRSVTSGGGLQRRLSRRILKKR